MSTEPHHVDEEGTAQYSNPILDMQNQKLENGNYNQDATFPGGPAFRGEPGPEEGEQFLRSGSFSGNSMYSGYSRSSGYSNRSSRYSRYGNQKGNDAGRGKRGLRGICSRGLSMSCACSCILSFVIFCAGLQVLVECLMVCSQCGCTYDDGAWCGCTSGEQKQTFQRQQGTENPNSRRNNSNGSNNSGAKSGQNLVGNSGRSQLQIGTDAVGDSGPGGWFGDR